MKCNLKKIVSLSVLLVLTFGTSAEVKANFTARYYDKLEPYEYRGTVGKRQFSETRYNKVRVLEITSEFDDPIEIRDVKLNRGNCKIWFPLTVLKWGQSGTGSILDYCNVREVTIETDRGSQILQWK